MKQSQDKNIEDILEIVQFLKDNMANKDRVRKDISALDEKIEKSFDNMRIEMDMKFEKMHEMVSDEVSKVKNDIMDRVDGFIGLHKKLDIEFAALRSKYERLES